MVVIEYLRTIVVSIKKKTHTVKGSRCAGLDPSSPPANLRLCWLLGVPAVAAAAGVGGVGGVGMVWWCGDDTRAQTLVTPSFGSRRLAMAWILDAAPRYIIKY